MTSQDVCRQLPIFENQWKLNVYFLQVWGWENVFYTVKCSQPIEKEKNVRTWSSFLFTPLNRYHSFPPLFLLPPNWLLQLFISTLGSFPFLFQTLSYEPLTMRNLVFREYLFVCLFGPFSGVSQPTQDWERDVDRLQFVWLAAQPSTHVDM